MIPASVITKEEDMVVMVSTGEYATENTHQQRVPVELKDSTVWLLQRVLLPADGGKKFWEQIKIMRQRHVEMGHINKEGQLEEAYGLTKTQCRSVFKLTIRFP